MDTEVTIPTLDRNKFWAQLAAVRFRPQDVKLPGKDWERLLLEDIPLDPGNGMPYLAVYSAHTITIKAGTRHYHQESPVKTLRSLAEEARKLRDKEHHHIRAMYDPAKWPDLKTAFLRLGEVLAFLGEEEIPFEQWGCLSISLPDVELPYDMSAPPLLPLDSFSNLRTLFWEGHRKQLIASWLPFTPTLLRTLTTLDIQCDLSLQDCCHMLFYGENLKEFTARIIQRDLSTEQMLGFVPPEASYTTRPLEYLCLVSDEDITPLLHPFSFPSLRRIHLTLAHPAWSTTFHEWKIWPTLHRIYLRGHFSAADKSWIVSQCPSAVKRLFVREPRYITGASSFIHKDPRRVPFFEEWIPDSDH